MDNIKLELYKFDSCPFCHMVMEHIEQLNLKVEYHDIQTDIQALNKLTSDTGRRTVPCLYIDGKPMFESRDIMQWLSDNEANLTKN